MAKSFLVSVDLNKNELQNARIQNLSTAPGSPVEGQIYYDTDDDKVYVWANGAWVSMVEQSGGVTYASSADLANVTKAAEDAGVLNNAARGDHKHDITTAAATGVGTANSEGSATSLARSDHVHATRSHDHSNAADGTTLTPAALIIPLATGPAQTANGSAVWDSDGFFLTVGDGSGRRTIYPVDDAGGDPAAVGTAAADGTAAAFARRDHVHAHEAAHINHDTTWAAKGDLIVGTANDTASVLTAGANDTILMADSGAGTGLKWVASQTPGTATFGQSAAEGTADTYARGDHAHGMPAHDGAAHSAVTPNHLGTPTADKDWGGFKITNLGTPTADNHAATKLYVDQAAQGLDAKASVRVATTGAITISTGLNSGDSIDGVTLADGDRVLVKNQAAPAENGIYVVSGSPARASDADTWDEHRSAFVWVEAGTVNSDTGWVSTVDAGGTLNTTAITWVQFAAAGAQIAGNGLTKTGNTFDVGAGTGIVANADDVAVLRTDANGRVPLRYAASYGDNSATTFNIDHNLNSLDVVVEVYTVSGGAKVEVDVVHSTVNRVVLTHVVAPTTNQYRVVVIG
jgi:hypothetical protein